MLYRSLYREWRPLTFSQIVGQDHIARTLINALERGKVAHAYLFAGPRGTGKTSTAKILAKALNCRSENRDSVEPCNQCESCLSIINGTSLDVLEIDAASNRGIDEIRALRDQVNFVPAREKYKIYIIDEVHMLTVEAFNALLKTLEEPPERVFFILATTEPHKLPATIISRCQRFDFYLISNDDIVLRLREIAASEKIKAEDNALEVLAVQAGGGMRDAIGLLEQCFAFAGEILTAETVYSLLGIAGSEQLDKFLQAVIQKDIPGGLDIIRRLTDHGRNLYQFVISLLGKISEQLITVAGDERDVYFAMADTFTELSKDLRQSDQPGLLLELSFLQLVSREDVISKLLQRVDDLEKALDGLSGCKVDTAGITYAPPKAEKKAEAEADAEESTEDIAPAEKSADNNQREAALTYIKKSWQEILESVRKEKPQSYAWLMEGTPVKIEGRVLIIRFPAEYNFHCENVGKAEHRRIIETVLQEVTGIEIQIKPALQTEKEQVDNKKPENAHTNTKNDATPTEAGANLEDAQQIFGGKVVNIDKK